MPLRDEMHMLIASLTSRLADHARRLFARNKLTEAQFHEEIRRLWRDMLNTFPHTLWPLILEKLIMMARQELPEEMYKENLENLLANSLETRYTISLFKKRSKGMGKEKMTYVQGQKITGRKGRIRRYNICLRCGWPWFSSGVKQPKQCPDCNSPYWYRSRMQYIDDDLSINQTYPEDDTT